MSNEPTHVLCVCCRRMAGTRGGRGSHAVPFAHACPDGKDFLCVQSMDGQLSFFEQDHASFTRQLKNCMLPGPITYCEKTDCIITASSELKIECYKYGMLVPCLSRARVSCVVPSRAVSFVASRCIALCFPPAGPPFPDPDVRHHVACLLRHQIPDLGGGLRFAPDQGNHFAWCKWCRRRRGCRWRSQLVQDQADQDELGVERRRTNLGAACRAVLSISCHGAGRHFCHGCVLLLCVACFALLALCCLLCVACLLASVHLCTCVPRWPTECMHACLPATLCCTRSRCDTCRLCSCAGEHTLFMISESGSVRMQKRLDYNPACAMPYTRGRRQVGASTQNMLVASHAKQLMVYNDVQLAWAAVLQSVPVALAVGTFGALPGLVVALDEAGTVRVTYMGTDPPTTGVSASDAKELNYEEMDEEHRRLLTQVKESHSENRPEPEDRVLLRAQVPSVLDAPDGEEGKMAGGAAGAADMPAQLTVRLFVSYTGRDEISHVNISLCVPDTVIAKETSFVLSSLGTRRARLVGWLGFFSRGGGGGGGFMFRVPSSHTRCLACAVSCSVGGRTPAIIPLVFRANPAVMPNNLSVRVAAAYITNNGEPRTAQIQVQLPLCLTCRLVAPLKNNTFKVRAVDMACTWGGVGCRVSVSVSVIATE